MMKTKAELKLIIKAIIEEVINNLSMDERQSLMEDYHHLHKEYRLYEGSTHITALFEDNSKLAFEVHFRNKHGEDREKHRKKAVSKWKTLANEIHRDAPLNEVGNPQQKSWKQAFEEALKHPDLQEYVRHSPHHRIYDPVNFTQMG